MTKIPITRPVLGEAELEAIRGPVESGWVVQGPRVEEFEQRFSKFTGAEHSVATTSCTTALHLAVAALGLEPGDEVIVPAFTWVSTANVVEYQGATPVFVDIDPVTFNIDPAAAADAVTDRTVGIIPVHLFGLCAEMDQIMEAARRHDLWVVEDAACGFGATYKGRHAGTIGHAGCFSFHPRKSITTGEGGMLTTDDAELAAVCRSLRDHGAARSDLDRHESRGAFALADFPRLGYNYRMTDIQGAIGCVQMDRAPGILDARRRLAARYDELLADRDWIRPPVVPDGHEHGYQGYVCRFVPDARSEDVEAAADLRDRILARLEDEGIATRQGTHAAALQRYYANKYGLAPEQFPEAHAAERLTITLPLYAQMDDDDPATVIEHLEAAYKELA